MQSVVLPTLDREWLIVDIGGGNEGLTARAGDQRVCAIDIRMDKIREAQVYQQTASWVCADGRTLCIQDACADAVTFWFSLGYIPAMEGKRSSLKEAFRILKMGGRLSILAISIDNEEGSLQFNADFTFPNGEISRTGFGISGKQEQTLEAIALLLQSIGFEVTETQNESTWFRIWAVKQ